MLNTELMGHVALVSGAGGEAGIGMAIARRLGASGAKLIVTASSSASRIGLKSYALKGLKLKAGQLTSPMKARCVNSACGQSQSGGGSISW